MLGATKGSWPKLFSILALLKLASVNVVDVFAGRILALRVPSAVPSCALRSFYLNFNYGISKIVAVEGVATFDGLCF